MDVKKLLDSKVELYNNPKFIDTDPIQIPHSFSKKEDIEISGFFAASLAWGQRKTIINKCNLLMKLMESAPHDFIINHQSDDLKPFLGFKHRTFNDTDLLYFISSLQNIYLNHGGLKNVLATKKEELDLEQSFIRFNNTFFETDYPSRTKKHVASPAKKSACKRLMMYMRWMVRKDDKGVDFGIWNSVKPSQLSCPLDVHSAGVARKVGLLTRKQNDWKAVQQLDESLRKFDDNDPAKYDFALFGLGIFEGFK